MYIRICTDQYINKYIGGGEGRIRGSTLEKIGQNWSEKKYAYSKPHIALNCKKDETR